MKRESFVFKVPARPEIRILLDLGTHLQTLQQFSERVVGRGPSAPTT